jgi:hypothetical protein
MIKGVKSEGEIEVMDEKVVIFKKKLIIEMIYLQKVFLYLREETKG